MASFPIFVLPLLLFFATIQRVESTNNTLVLQTKVIARVQTYLTGFLTSQQLTDALDLVTSEFVAGVAISQIENDLLNLVTSELTGMQLVQGLQAYNQLTKDLGGSSALTTIENALTTVIVNNFAALFAQVQRVLTKMRARGKGRFACINKIYRMGLQFMTYKRMRTLVNRVKNSLSTSVWTAAKNDLGSLVVLFTKFGV